ncbi:MAG: amidohydrolase, partial [Planctomycetaceae bacterium]|nr:amidohydrolase [Planctomycetaceae bacterium]
MIVDIHSHIWRYPDHFSDDFRNQARRARAGMEVDLTVRWEDYDALSQPDVRTIVFGGKAKLSGV